MTTVFDRDRMLCARTHLGGQHGNESPAGEWLGVGQGACNGETSLGECDCPQFRQPTLSQGATAPRPRKPSPEKTGRVLDPK